MRQLRVHYLPESIAGEDLARATAVVIDVLRATTTIVHALAAGARAVIPCLTIDQARDAAAAFQADGVVLGGERGGRPIAGFDLGNSPAEYAPASVGGKTVVLTTTNGTKALLQCAGAEQILIGAFVNLSALCTLLAERQNIDLVCAGTDGHVTREDVLLAGAVVDRLAFDGSGDAAGLGAECRSASGPRGMGRRGRRRDGPSLFARLVEAMLASRGGENLIALNMAADIELAAQIDRFAIVPRFDPSRGRIVVDSAAGHMP